MLGLLYDGCHVEVLVAMEIDRRWCLQNLLSLVQCSAQTSTSAAFRLAEMDLVAEQECLQSSSFVFLFPKLLLSLSSNELDKSSRKDCLVVSHHHLGSPSLNTEHVPPSIR